MPIKVFNKTYKTFRGAARAVHKRYGWPMTRCNAYVARIEMRQKKGRTKHA